MTTASRFPRDLRRPAAEAAVQVALMLGAAQLVALLHGRDLPERALGTLTFAAGVAATILLGVAAWMSGDRAARRVAAAVGTYTAVALLIIAVQADVHHGWWSLAAGVGTAGAAALLLTAVLRVADPGRDRVVGVGLLVSVATGLSAVGLSAVLGPGHVPPPAVVAALHVGACSATCLAGLVLVGAGYVVDRPLLRRCGLAFATLGGAHVLGVVTDRPQLTGVLELGATAMLLVTAAPALVTAVRAVGRVQEDSRRAADRAAAAMATLAERDHELRNVVAGLSGAASVLRDGGVAGTGAHRLLLAAGSELQRLQTMLDGRRSSVGATADVGTVLRDLATVHAARGLAVQVQVRGRPEAAAGSDALAQIVANLLVNCARHAPGARVLLRAGVDGREVRIEVADDGPGLPPGGAAAALRRGVRGAGSTGDGLGLAVVGDLVRRHRGRFALESSAAGCTAVIHLPVAGRPVRATVGVS